MRIITCASYYGTGSTAVTDLLSEFSTVHSFGEFEYRFLQDPDGVSDLEYNLIENNHRHNTSNAIKRFKNYIKSTKSFAYGGGYDIFKNKFIDISYDYIDNITELKTKTWWYIDRINKGELFCVFDRAYSLFRRLLSLKLNDEKKFSILANREQAYYSSISENKFLMLTKKYVDDVIKSVLDKNYDYVMVDQMVPPTNIDRYLRYFNDVKVIVVDRDPRDVYIFEEKKYQSGIIPTKNVYDYIKWFKITRKYSNPEIEDRDKILRIKFEDLIFNYDNTVRQIIDFCGLSFNNHINVKKIFNPDVSINNTNMIRYYPEYKEQINIIEKELKEYLYNFK